MARSLSFGLRHAETTDDIVACFDALHHLRPQLRSPEDWCRRAQAMRHDGYQILAYWDERRAVAVAGYRLQENLVHGQFLFVNDLVTLPDMRGMGLGAALLRELGEAARVAGCGRMVLDTGASNVRAQSFYRREGWQDVIVGFVKNVPEVT